MDLVINDQSITNDRGWRLLNAGLDQRRYDANPVLLYQHDTGQIIGKCTGLRIEGSRLVGSFEFDEGDPLAVEAKRKAEGGFLRGVSPGFYIQKMDFGEEFDTVTRWELLEISLVTIPSNRAAIRLYSREGNALTDAEEERYLATLRSQYENTQITHTMTDPHTTKVALAAEALTALGMETAGTVAEISAAVIAMSSELSALRTEKEKHKQEERDALLNAAIQGGKIKEADRATYEELFASNETLCRNVLSSIVAPTPLSASVRPDGTKGGQYEGSWDELDKAGKLAALRKENPDLFMKKYNEKFGN